MNSSIRHGARVAAFPFSVTFKTVRHRLSATLPLQPIKMPLFAADRPRSALPLEELPSDIADSSEQKNIITVISSPYPQVSVLTISLFTGASAFCSFFLSYSPLSSYTPILAIYYSPPCLPQSQNLRPCTTRSSRTTLSMSKKMALA